MSRIFKRTGSKKGVWWIQFYQDGKQYRESSRSTTKEVAKSLLRRREGQIEEGIIPGRRLDRVRFDELAAEYLVDYRINNQVIERAEVSVEHLRKAFGGRRVVEIDTPRVMAYIQVRQGAGAANGTINRELAALKRILTLGARQTPPKVNRVPHIPRLKEDNVRKGFFEHQQFLALRDALPAHLQGLVTFAYKTGWRLSEITGLEWRHVDLGRGVVRLDPGETKNKEGRTVYLDEELREIFGQFWEARKRQGRVLPFVFLNARGNDRIGKFYKPWKKACQKVGVGHRLFHDFRRTAVRNMVRAGTSERVVMTITGHRTRSVFDRYNIVNEADLEEATRKQTTYLDRDKSRDKLKSSNV